MIRCETCCLGVIDAKGKQPGERRRARSLHHECELEQQSNSPWGLHVRAVVKAAKGRFKHLQLFDAEPASAQQGSTRLASQQTLLSVHEGVWAQGLCLYNSSTGCVAAPHAHVPFWCLASNGGVADDATDWLPRLPCVERTCLRCTRYTHPHRVGRVASASTPLDSRWNGACERTALWRVGWRGRYRLWDVPNAPLLGLGPRLALLAVPLQALSDTGLNKTAGRIAP